MGSANKKIMILGAGIYQLPLIDRARRLGLETLVVSIPGNYPGFDLAHQIHYLNTTDQEGILRLARAERISAITTCGTDVAVRSLGYVCEKLGLPGIDYACARLCTNKVAMKQALRAAGVRTPAFQEVESESQALQAARQLGFPVMVKCVDKSGSRGIMRADQEDQVARAYQYARAASAAPYVLVEHCLAGPELGVDGFISADQEVLWLHDKIAFFNGAANVGVGHVIPPQITSAQRQDVLQQAHQALQALKINNSFFDMDIILAREGASIIEVGARMGANCIPEMISGAYGFDCYEQILRCALGQPPQLQQQLQHACAVQLLRAPQDGILNQLALRRPLVGVEVQFDYGPGDAVRQFSIGPDRIGHLVAVAETGAAALQKVQEAQEELLLVYEASAAPEQQTPSALAL